MPHLKNVELRKISRKIFEAAGVPAADAVVVADMLVDAELMGLASHGVQRILQYVADFDNGSIVPGAEITIEQRSNTTAIVDGHWNFGQLVATRAAETAIAMAKEHGTGCTIVRACRHVGRLGAYTEICAAAGCLGIAMTAGGKEGHWVAPFGGREGRLGTNPIAFSAPTVGDPIVMDFSTSIVPEGKVRLLRDQGKQFQSPVLVDEHGLPSTDPDDLYQADGSPAGAILPFGGDQGYKGYGLSLMVSIMASALGTSIWNSDGVEALTNGTMVLAINIDAFSDSNAFRHDIQRMVDYVKSSLPIEGGGVMMPGQREFEMMRQRQSNGLLVDDNIWSLLTELASSHGVDVC